MLGAVAFVATLGILFTLNAIVSQPAPEPTPDPLAVAMERCISAHPAVDEYISTDGTGRTVQTAEQACDRWLAKVGDPAFTQQWTQEYADVYRLTIGQE